MLTEKQITKLVRSHACRIYNLGFVEGGLASLQALYEQQDDIDLKNRAARELALWHANQNNVEHAQQCLQYLSSINEKKRDLFRERTVLEAKCLHILGRTKEAKRLVLTSLNVQAHTDLFLAAANLERSLLARVMWLNKVFRHHGLLEVLLGWESSTESPPFDCLHPEWSTVQKRRRVDKAPLVSVIVPAYNAQTVVTTALDSLLNQTWTELEIIVVDDGSTDRTTNIVQEYTNKDNRIKLIKNKYNRGPFEARNLGLRAASGEFVTVHDADDWAHPEKIEKQAVHLLNNQDVIANTSQQILADELLNFYHRVDAGLYLHHNLSSLMFRRRPVLKRVGYWDCIRFGADIEFQARLKKVFGTQAVVKLRTGPLSIQRKTDHALGEHKAFGFKGSYMMGARKEYFESFSYYHETAENLRLDFPQQSSPFPVPEPMWPSREAKMDERRHFDVIIASDFRLPGGTTTSNVEEIKAQRRLGLRTGLIQMSRFNTSPEKAINPKIRDLIDGDQVQMIVYGEKVSCDVLIIKHPSVLQHWQSYVPDVKAEKVYVIINQTPYREYGQKGSKEYEIVTCVDNCQKYFGQTGLWYPSGPLVRKILHQHHQKELEVIALSSEDWSEIIDVNEWRRPARPQRGPLPRIGRHSRDQDVKWPHNPDELLAIYPDKDFEVYILGGAEIPKKILGTLPSNWNVLQFGETDPKDFLAKLDVFVYYTHPDLVEAFGRVILEAMAVGVPVIIPPVYRELFGEAAVYAEPCEVKDKIKQLMADDHYYQVQVEKAYRYVEQHFGYARHAARIGVVK